MSQRASIVVAATALAAVLCLPAPAHAAPIRAGLPSVTLWERAWSWLMQLVPGMGWEKEGGMINPDGRTTSSTPPSAPPAEGLNEGGAINPDGSK